MNKEFLKFYDAVCCIPWMQEPVKVGVKISRRDVLILSQVIEHGLAKEELKGMIPAEAADGLRAMIVDLLSKTEVPEAFIRSFGELLKGKPGI
jgi:hypoxanthine-guanine phosphoribosyltransferase